MSFTFFLTSLPASFFSLTSSLIAFVFSSNMDSKSLRLSCTASFSSSMCCQYNIQLSSISSSLKKVRSKNLEQAWANTRVGEGRLVCLAKSLEGIAHLKYCLLCICNRSPVQHRQFLLTDHLPFGNVGFSLKTRGRRRARCTWRWMENLRHNSFLFLLSASHFRSLFNVLSQYNTIFRDTYVL